MLSAGEGGCIVREVDSEDIIIALSAIRKSVFITKNAKIMKETLEVCTTYNKL